MRRVRTESRLRAFAAGVWSKSSKSNEWDMNCAVEELKVGQWSDVVRDVLLIRSASYWSLEYWGDWWSNIRFRSGSDLRMDYSWSDYDSASTYSCESVSFVEVPLVALKLHSLSNVNKFSLSWPSRCWISSFDLTYGWRVQLNTQKTISRLGRALEPQLVDIMAGRVAKNRTTTSGERWKD